MVTSRRGIGETNSDGYFQIETTANDVLLFETENGQSCRFNTEGLNDQRDFAALGKVICK
jgi:hypothetical protein